MDVVLDYFKNEGRVMAQLKHPGIVAVDEFGQTDGHYWLRMELIEGVATTSGKRLLTLHDYYWHLGGRLKEQEVAECMRQRLHFNTYGGNPVSMAQGIATLNVLLEDKVQQHAGEVGGYLKQGLEDLQSRHSLVGDVRGQGLMLGMELVEDRATKAPATARTAAPPARARP